MTLDPIFTVAAVITALGVLLGALYSIYKLASRIGAAIGLDKEGRTISDRLSRVEHQLWPNGGNSLADRVAKIEENTINTTAKLEIIETVLTSQWWYQSKPETVNQVDPMAPPKRARGKKAS
jgi:hypothetical protein